MRVAVCEDEHVNFNLKGRMAMPVIQRVKRKKDTPTTEDLRSLIRIANEGYSATWLCDYAEMLSQAGELAMEIGEILNDMNGDLRKLTKAQMVPANRRRIARGLKRLIKFNNRMDKAVSIVEKASLAY